MKRDWCLFSVVAGLFLLTLTLAGQNLSAEEGSLVDCARDEAQRNFNAFRDYQCDMTSYRKAWTLDGELDRDNVIVKKLYVRHPDKRKEVFVSGAFNGKPAKEKDFLWERLGMSKGLNMYDIEAFRKDKAQYFSIVEEGTLGPGGNTFRVLAFESKDQKKTQLIKGRILLPADSCRTTRMNGIFLHRMIQKNIVSFKITFDPVKPDLWLPKEIIIEGKAKLGPLKRKIYGMTVFENYKVDAGVPDSIFE